MKRRFCLYNPPTYRRVNPKNKDFLKDYLLELEMRGRASGTIKAYRSDIREFFCWLVAHGNPYVLDCRKRVFRDYFLVLIKNQTSHNRINRIHSSLKCLLEFAANDDDEYRNYEVNVMNKIPSLERKPVRKIYFLSDQDITKMLRYLISKKQYEIALYLSLSYDSAGRRREVSEVAKNGFLDHKLTNTVRGKRGKHFRLMYGNRTRRIAKLYLNQRGDDSNESLWTVGYESLYLWCRYLRVVYKRIAGKVVNFNPHSFRHSSLNNFSNGTHIMLRENHIKKLPISLLSKVGHHSDISTTKNYLKDTDEQKLKSIFNL